jgi:hypothetical protein
LLGGRFRLVAASSPARVGASYCCHADDYRRRPPIDRGRAIRRVGTLPPGGNHSRERPGVHLFDLHRIAGRLHRLCLVAPGEYASPRLDLCVRQSSDRRPARSPRP